MTYHDVDPEFDVSPDAVVGSNYRLLGHIYNRDKSEGSRVFWDCSA